MEMEATRKTIKTRGGQATTQVSTSAKRSAPSSESNESSPLISTNATSKEWKRNQFVYKLVAVGVALLVVAFAIAANTLERTPKPIPIEPQEPKMELVFRPYCETYGSTSATIVQTSIGQPSRQWSSVPCYSTNPEHGLFGRPKKAIVDEYQVPDAVLQVDFETPGQINRSVPILGFGGAFTEAAALNYESLSQTGKDVVMELLFGKSGLGYSLGRVHINSCDFSVKPYTFDETDGDFQLKDFDVGVHHDVEVGMVDMMLRATSVLREAWGSEDGVDGDFKIYASPWSPPSWMKAPTPDDPPGAVHAEGMTNSAQPTCLRDGVGPDSKYAEAWALYFSKFLTACKLVV
jgi:glucosylceramidase